MEYVFWFRIFASNILHIFWYFTFYNDNRFFFYVYFVYFIDFFYSNYFCTMKKLILLLILILSFFSFSFASASYSEDLTIYNNWYCVESDHIWPNDCNKTFNDVLHYFNYYQNNTSTGKYVWFHFYTPRKITRYSLINTNFDNTFQIKSWHFEALTSSGWILLHKQENFSVIVWRRTYFEVVSPVLSDEYRIVFDEVWIDWVLLTQIEMFEDWQNKTLYLDNPNLSNTWSYINLITQDNYWNYWFSKNYHDWQDLTFYWVIIVIIWIYLFFKIFRVILDLFFNP